MSHGIESHRPQRGARFLLKGIPQPCSMEVQPDQVFLEFLAFGSFVCLCVFAAGRGHEALPLLERFSSTGASTSLPHTCLQYFGRLQRAQP